MKRKLPQNYIEITNDSVTMHYVTHKKEPMKVIESVKRSPENAEIIHGMILTAKKGGFLFVK